MVQMSLMERERELAVLGGLLDETLSGAGGVAVVTGPVASGKTAVLREIAQRTEAAGGVFLSATGSRAERALPLGLVSQLLYGADMPADGLDEVQSTLDRTPAAVPYDQRSLGETELEDLGAAIGVRPATLHRLSKVFLDLAADSPVVIGVDDAHYADAASLLVLLHLAHRLRTAPVLLVFTQCSRPHARGTLFQTELLHQLGCVGVRLRTLGEEGVRAVLTERLGARRAAVLAGSVHHVSGGNPLLVTALADDQQTEAADSISGELAVGEAFGRAVATCLFRCEATMRDAVHAVAVLGDDAEPRLVADVLDVNTGTATDVLDALEEAGLLLEGRFRHEAARDAALRAMPPERPPALHARAAAALRNRHGAAGRVAQHLVAAGGSKENWALETLSEAAEQALRDDDVPLAVDCLAMALEMTTHPRRRAEIQSALLRAEWRINPSAAARHLPDLCEAARQALLDCRDLTALVAQLLWLGRLEEAAEVVETISAHLAQYQVTPEPNTLTIGLMISQAFPELSDRMLPSWLRPEPVDSRTGRGLHLKAATSLAGVLSGEFGPDAVEAAEAVLQSSRLDEDTLSAIVVALVALVYADRGERALYWCRHLAEDATHRNAPVWAALLGALQSVTHLRRGELHAAEKHARAALDLVPAASWGAAAGLPLSAAVTAATALGRLDEAAELLALPVPDVVFRTPAGLLYLQARGRHHLAAGRLQAALGDFLRCGELMENWNLDAPNLVPWRIEAAAATLRLGRDQEARRLLEEQLALAGPQDQRTRGRALSLLAVTVGDPTGRAGLLAQSLENLQSSGDWYEQMQAGTQLARTYEELGDTSAARAEWGRVRLLAELCGLAEPAGTAGASDPGGPAATGAEPPAGPAIRAVQDRREPNVGTHPPVPALTRAAHGTPPATSASGAHTPGSPVPGPRGPQHASVKQLTRAERRVVALAADGHTNRQIASKLFITVSTVEQHLTRAYRKLRVNRRSDLPVHLLSDVAS
jgi:DNA-binding CsgD family transcriptional regulator/tetratricopeptide (TPR) repeat protein